MCGSKISKSCGDQNTNRTAFTENFEDFFHLRTTNLLQVDDLKLKRTIIFDKTCD